MFSSSRTFSTPTCAIPRAKPHPRQANDRSTLSREFENRLARKLPPKCLHRPDNLVQTFHGLLQSFSGDPDGFKHYLHHLLIKMPQIGCQDYMPHTCHPVFTVDFVTELPCAPTRAIEVTNSCNSANLRDMVREISAGGVVIRKGKGGWRMAVIELPLAPTTGTPRSIKTCKRTGQNA